MRFNVFISSVQKEFAQERLALADYLRTDALLSTFFIPFLFEETAATNQDPATLYLQEVANAQIYIGLLGQDYGYEVPDGISATEKEYNTATEHHLPRWIYIKGNNTLQRDPKENMFIAKVGDQVSRKRFLDLEELKKEVYQSCIGFLKRKGLISSTDFDQALAPNTSIATINQTLLNTFLARAKAKRNFPLDETTPIADVLTHLNLYRDQLLVNSALLLFTDNPQQYFPAATIKCAHFHGNHVQKPIPDYKEYKGNVYNQIEEAVDFVLSKISLSTGTRANANTVETQYEVPRAAISEAIINAVAHRDYTSKASIQISVFKNRIEISNPGRLPDELTIESLGKSHKSYPHNLNLADCFFQTGTIERYGTGTLEIYKLSEARGLHKPQYTIDEGITVTLWRPSATGQVTGQATGQATGQVELSYSSFTSVERVILAINDEMKSAEIQAKLELSHRETFRDNYLLPSIKEGLVEMTIPDKPKSPKQKYRLTEKGKRLKEGLQ